VYRSDFQGPMDIIPVSDPEIFTEVQRVAQMQIVAQRAQLMPQLYDLHKVEKLILSYTKIPDAVSLLNPAPEIEEMNAVNENVAMALGRPVHAYPDQDHLAHVQVLVDFIDCPMLGMSPIIAPAFLNAALTHLKEHIVMWYADFMQKQASMRVKEAGAPKGIGIAELLQYKDPETRQEADKLLAGISSSLIAESANAAFKEIPAVIQKAQQILQQQQQGQQQAAMANPVAAARIQTAQIAADSKAKELQQQQAADQAEQQLAQQKMQQEAQQGAAETQADSQRTATETQADMAQTQATQAAENQRASQGNQTKELINAADNQTALDINAANAAAKTASNVTTGTAVGKERPGE
jgi:hypothetical protein